MGVVYHVKKVSTIFDESWNHNINLRRKKLFHFLQSDMKTHSALGDAIWTPVWCFSTSRPIFKPETNTKWQSGGRFWAPIELLDDSPMCVSLAIIWGIIIKIKIKTKIIISIITLIVIMIHPMCFSLAEPHDFRTRNLHHNHYDDHDPGWSPSPSSSSWQKLEKT